MIAIKSWPMLVGLLCVAILSSCSKDESKTVVINEIPVDIPVENTVGVVTYEEGVSEGYTLFSAHKSSFLINNCGQLINSWTSEYVSSHSVYLLEDGSILRTGRIENDDFPYAGLGGIIEKINWNNQVVWSYEYSSSDYSQHHDAFPMPNGNVMLLVAERKTNAEVVQAGKDIDKLLGENLYTEKLIEIQPSGANQGTVVWEWDAWDHMIQEFDATKDNFGVVAGNPQLIDVNFVSADASNNGADWLHSNSIDFNPATNQILISLNGVSEYWIIDHATTTEEAAGHSGGLRGKGGDILYRWGNPAAYQQGDKSDQKLIHQHYPYWIPEGYPDAGKIMVFNNRKGEDDLFSTVDLIDFPGGNQGVYSLNANNRYSPETSNWSYVDPNDAENFYSRILSSAQRQKNGNTLICEGTKGHFFEINPDNEIVWQYFNPINTAGEIAEQGNPPAFNSVFRAFKYSEDYEAFSNRNLVPKNPIELNFNIGNCK